MDRTICIKMIIEERERQESKYGYKTGSQPFDAGNTQNDWVAYITAYAGMAANCSKNINEGYDFFKNMVKVAALALAAMESDPRR